MKNLQILLLLIAFIFRHAYSTADEELFDASSNETNAVIYASMRWRDCVEHPYLANKTAHVAYLSKSYVSKFQWKIQMIEYSLEIEPNNYELITDYFLPKDEPLAPYLLSVCLCRRGNFDLLFFMIPYVNSTSDDIVAVCVIGTDNENFTSTGIYDDEELYDLLMVKYHDLISSSVMEPVPFSKNIVHSGCYDLDHYPTKDVMGQKTCLFSAYAVNNSMNEKYLYSGPLMSSPLLNQNLDGLESFCYSTVENSTNTLNDTCFFEHSFEKSTFACCCPKNPELCSISQKKEDHYYCLPGLLLNYRNTIEYFSVEKYFYEYYKPACVAFVGAQFNNTDILVAGVSFHGIDSCENIDGNVLDIYPSNFTFCSENKMLTKNLSFAMTKCCSGEHLCNFELIPPEFSDINWEDHTMCGTLEAPALYAALNLKCGAYYDLSQIKEENNYLGQKKNLYNGFNAKFVKEQSRNGINYLVAKIMKADNESCNDIVIQHKDVNKYFPFYNCGEEECQNPSILSFECEQSNAQKQKKSNTSWFCYVIIIPKQKDEIDVKAGFLSIKNFHECFTQNVFEYDRCCVNVFNQTQADTGCTIENMTLSYQKYLQAQKNASHELPDSEKKFTECLQRDIGPEQKCPGNDGCFEITSLTESDESEVVEPAGCLGLAEDYALGKLDMTNLALGCRADLNSNRCSMVHSPSGEERIVCCCNHPDENGKCKTEAQELPQKVGKPISSFKTLKS